MGYLPELSDVAVRGGHCYMVLLQKNESTGATEAKARAAIWANIYARIRTEFLHATGQEFASGMKVMVRASVSMHPVYGLSLVVNAVNPAYTMGDLIRRRNEMLARLKAEGIIDLNRSLRVGKSVITYRDNFSRGGCRIRRLHESTRSQSDET